jgi:hypothetical protein
VCWFTPEWYTGRKYTVDNMNDSVPSRCVDRIIWISVFSRPLCCVKLHVKRSVCVCVLREMICVCLWFLRKADRKKDQNTLFCWVKSSLFMDAPDISQTSGWEQLFCCTLYCICYKVSDNTDSMFTSVHFLRVDSIAEFPITTLSLFRRRKKETNTRRNKTQSKIIQ